MPIEEPKEKNLIRFLREAIFKHKIKEGNISYEGWEGHYTTERGMLGIPATCDVRLHKENKVLQICYDLLRKDYDCRQTYTRDLNGHLHTDSLSIRIA